MLRNNVGPTLTKEVFFDYDDSQNCETLFWTNPEESVSTSVLCLHGSVDLSADYPWEELKLMNGNNVESTLTSTLSVFETVSSDVSVQKGTVRENKHVETGTEPVAGTEQVTYTTPEKTDTESEKVSEPRTPSVVQGEIVNADSNDDTTLSSTSQVESPSEDSVS